MLEEGRRVEPAHGYAQTIIQLLNQLAEAGAGEQELIRTRSSYMFVTSLLGTWLRPSGKPFVDHLVGTASILSAHGQSQKLIEVGLLHAVYQRGDFGNARTGIAEWKRQRVAGIAGKDVEEVVAAYTKLVWGPEELEKLSGRVGTLAKIEMEPIVVRLANELEDFLDLGMSYCNKRSIELLYSRHLETCKDLATAAGVPALGSELEYWVRLNEDSKLPRELKTAATGAYSVIPASHPLRPTIRARKALGRVVRRVRRVHK